MRCRCAFRHMICGYWFVPLLIFIGDPLNYLASLSFVCCKVLERVIVLQVVDYLEPNGALSVNQFGCHTGRSFED